MSVLPAAGQRINDEQARAIAHSGRAGSLALRGAAGSGKSFALLRRAARLAQSESVLLTAPSDAGVARLRAAVGEDGIAARLVCATFGEVAFDTLREVCDVAVARIDEHDASLRFEDVGAALFALDWTEFALAEIDPEITGLRTPERFAAAAFRLIRKLRAALVSPEEFRLAGLRGATEFYAKAPNFADATLLMATPPKYRDSLRVSGAELERQREREVDLVRILARLYTSYADMLAAHGCLTPIDAVYEAARVLKAQTAARAVARERYGAILVDDAQDLGAAQIAFLEGIASEGLANVTFAGDPDQSTRSFVGGGRGCVTLAQATTTIELQARYRSPAAIEGAARLVLEQKASVVAKAPASSAVSLYRASDVREEARYVAADIHRRVASGTNPEKIAVVARNLRCVGSFVDALLARDVPVDVAGAASLFDFGAVADALGALWCVVDPYRHDYVLRALQSSWVGLSDASLAILCGDAEVPQPLLFTLPDEDPSDTRARRWDRRRDLRLGRNVTRGDVDPSLSSDGRERLAHVRAALARWEALSRELEPLELARVIVDETVIATSDSGARGRFERHLYGRLTDMLQVAAARDPLASLHDLLVHIERVAGAEDDLLAMELRDPCAVRVIDVEAAKGETFDAVYAVDVRAGAWPRYYVPDAFLFLPSLGMVPKENVGDTNAARTAKFTYALYRSKLREKYNAEDRRALYTALSRAKDFLSVSASGRASRGVSAPELLEELRAAVA